MVHWYVVIPLRRSLHTDIVTHCQEQACCLRALTDVVATSVAVERAFGEAHQARVATQLVGDTYTGPTPRGRSLYLRTLIIPGVGSILIDMVNVEGVDVDDVPELLEVD